MLNKNFNNYGWMINRQIATDDKDIEQEQEQSIKYATNRKGKQEQFID